MELMMIINGVDVPVQVSMSDPIRVARDLALVPSNNTGRPVNEWEVHNEYGECIDPNTLIEEMNVFDGDRFFITLQVGAGGIKQEAA